ncbi:MAG TPA: T9SS type A sorting domain-containing protein, partial [Bacteroidia bacterium]|nr:T9SS type A sorting domain-containing protein [Bacteroidia bacterium]
AMTYRQQGVDFWPGPIDTVTLVASSSLCSSFDGFYPIYKTQVDSQKNNLYTAGTMPQQILNWPGNGVSAENTSYKLAPYVDVNHNNMYDPLNGDYPIMYGDYGIYQIANDVGNTHGESGGAAFGIETHITQYVVGCTSDTILWNTMFTHYELINRSANTYHNFDFTMWLDFDLGNYADDYIGCDTSLNLFYVYNGDNYDEDAGGLTGYHDRLPAFGGMFLNKKMSVFTTYSNTGSAVNGNPSSTGGGSIFNNLMSGVWENGSAITYGGNGQTTTGQSTKFLYSGDPYTNTGWTESNAGQLPNDVRGLGSCTQNTFNPYDTLKIDFAYIFAPTNSSSNVESVHYLKQNAQSVQNYYNSNTTPCGSTFTSAIKQNGIGNNNQVIVYPNPSSGSINIKSTNNIDGLKITNMLGQVIYEAKLQSQNASFQIESAGIYFVTTTVGKEINVQKVVVNK